MKDSSMTKKETSWSEIRRELAMERARVLWAHAAQVLEDPTITAMLEGEDTPPECRERLRRLWRALFMSSGDLRPLMYPVEIPPFPADE